MPCPFASASGLCAAEIGTGFLGPNGVGDMQAHLAQLHAQGLPGDAQQEAHALRREAEALLRPADPR